MTFTRRTAWLAAGAALLTLFAPTMAGAALLVAILAAGIADAWVVRSTPPIDREAPPLLSRGVPGVLTVTTLPGIRVRQSRLSPDLVVNPVEGIGSLAATVVATRRGAHGLGPVATLRVGPLGLGGWYHRNGDEHRITVYPDLPAAQRLATEVRLGLFREDGRRARGPLGLGTELESVREYQPDDDIRQLNWPATVRTGRPMSNTYRIEQDRDVICLIDCGRLMASPISDEQGTKLTRLDAAVDAAAAVAAVADELGDRIGAIAFADSIIAAVAPRRDGGRIVVDAIHALEPKPVDSDYDLAVSAVGARKRSFILILTDLLDPVAAQPLSRALPVLTRHHPVTVATVQDPAIRSALDTPAADDNELARTVVAADVTLGRTAANAELERAGVNVLDVSANSLSRRCVGAYLSAKRLARI
ncbi:MAG: DUF58 domain-containing protein [Acidimicrobiia bacterium]|nr:DUF58 domain-containing protein [Acidimicrobiia bacterium]